MDATVDLDDQFGQEQGVLVGKPKRFCTAMDKNGEGISYSSANLACYKTSKRQDIGDVSIENPIDAQTLTIVKPKFLCVPSEIVEVVGEDTISSM